MGRKFDGGADDVIKRLHGTICMYKGEPVYVMGYIDRSTGGYSATHVQVCPVQSYDRYGSRDKKNSWEIIDYTQDTFRYKAFPLGYVNHNGRAYYASRIPNRYQYYGLSPDSILWEPIVSSSHHIVFTDSFVDMIHRRYPNMDDAETRLIAGERRIAISPDVAIERVKGRTMHLLFKGKNVGIKMGATHNFTMYDIPEAPFLKKILARSGVHA